MSSWQAAADARAMLSDGPPQFEAEQHRRSIDHRIDLVSGAAGTKLQHPFIEPDVRGLTSISTSVHAVDLVDVHMGDMEVAASTAWERARLSRPQTREFAKDDGRRCAVAAPLPGKRPRPKGLRSRRIPA
jgi:hypothetical protein